MPSRLVKKYLREDMMPHIWCPGCGHGIIMHDIITAIDRLELDPDKVMIVSGIGCSSRASGYMNFNTIHTTHGRAIAVATGIKLSRPDMKVIVLTGDGDAVAIGGNHFIHAARRNIDMTVIVFNNSIYGMTGGQYSPTTPRGEFGTTAPYGSIDQDFDICKLAVAAGATYVGRGTAYHVAQTTKLIQNGIDHCGFSVIDAIVQCPTYYGRKNKKGDAVDMLKYFKEHSISHDEAQNLYDSDLKGLIVTGLIYKHERPEYCQQYEELIARAKEGR